MTSIRALSFAAAAIFALMAFHGSASAAGTISYNWTGSQAIPDNNPSGVAFSFNVSAGAPLFITDVNVDLNIAGGWNGDLYAYLSHGSGFSVLLNRIGSAAANPGGSGVSGMNVELSDGALTDIHLALNNPLTGSFQPDGRNINPLNALDADPRSAFLGSFNGLDPNGLWTLFVADVSPLGVSTLQSWTVNIGVAVPEPASLSFVGLAVAWLIVRHRSREKSW